MSEEKPLFKPQPKQEYFIEYLQLSYPGQVRLLPADPMAALDVRFLDRFFCNVMATEPCHRLLKRLFIVMSTPW